MEPCALKGHVSLHCMSHYHVKSPRLGMIFNIMREKVGERSVLGSPLVQTWFGSIFASLSSGVLPSGKHSTSAFLQEMLLKRHRVSVISKLYTLWSRLREPKSSPCSVSEAPHPQVGIH